MVKKIEIAKFDLANLEKLLDSTEQLKIVMDELSTAQKQLKKDGDTSSKTFIQNEADLKTLRKEYNAHIKVLAEANNKIADQANREKLLSAALNQEVKSINDARAGNKLLNKLRNSANTTTAEGRAEIEKLNAALDSNNAFIKENVDQYAQQKIGIGGYKDAITEALNELNPFNISVQRNEGSFKKLVTAIKGAARATLAFTATPLGAFLAVLTGVGLIVKQFFDYNESIREARILTESMTNATGELADEIRLRAGVINEVFGNDLQETIKAARNLVTAFGISYSEAFDLIEDGLTRGGSKNDNFISSITEYPKFFASAGFSAQEFLNIIGEGADLGIFDDKLQDSLKEFSITIEEQTTAAKDALINAFGADFTNELFGNIQTGAITAKDALQEIARESTKASLNAQQQAQLTADLFKGAGEDAGGALLIFEAVNNALTDEEVILTELELQIARQIEAQKELTTAKDEALKSDSIIALQLRFQELSLWVETKFYQVIGGIGDVFTHVSDRISAGLSAIKVFLEQTFSFEQFDFSQVEEAYNTTLTNLQSSREAAIEISKRQDEAEVEQEKLKQNRLLQAQKDAANRKAQAAAEAHERELEREEAQLEKLHEQVRAALDRKDEERLAAIQSFEDRRRELTNEIDIANAETDLEKELLQIEQRFEKDILELERITLTEEQKTELLLLLTENREIALQSVKDKYAKDAAKKQSLVDAAEVKQKQKNSAAVAQVQNALVSILTGLLGDSLGAKLAAIGIEAAIEAGTVGVKTASSNAQNLLQATAAAPPPANLAFISAAGAQNAINTANSAAAISTILASAALKGIGTAISGVKKFESGGMIEGNRHSQGGRLIEAEGGEFIFSRKAVNMWGSGVLGSMNKAAKGKSGVNYSGFFADGGQVSRSISSGSGVGLSEVRELITDSIGNIKVINDPNETLEVFGEQQIIVENASA